MRYYEIRTENSTIDIVTNREDRFVCYIPVSGLLRGYKMEEADGVISSDGQFVWQIKGKNELPGERQEVEFREILTSEEYEEIKSRLEADGSIPEPEEPNTEEPAEPQEEIMGPIEMRLKIKELSANLEEQTKRNDFLEECLLEMSEIVYA